MNKKINFLVLFVAIALVYVVSNGFDISKIVKAQASICDGVAAWDANKVYANAGTLVVRTTREYKNNWWTQGNDPLTSSGPSGSGQPWTFVGDCSTVPGGGGSGGGTGGGGSGTGSTTDPSLPTTIKFTPLSTASGVINYHLNLPYGSGNVEKLNLSANYTDLITSNYVAGALLGRLIHEKDPNLNFNKDYVYGSLLGQLLQENIDTGGYLDTTDWINPNITQRDMLLAPGQGGPYQINDYSKRLESDKGIGLINFTALQKGLGYTVEQQDSGSQTLSKGPSSLDQKYFGPMAAAYFHLNDMNRLAMNNSESWGPQYQYYDKCMNNLRQTSSAIAANNNYDMILNAAYNAGTYSAIIKDYFRICAGMYTLNPEITQLKSIGDYTLSDTDYRNKIGTSEAAGTTFILYPRQIRIYLDQLYNQKTFNSAAITGTNSIKLSVQDIEYVFENAMGTLAYINSSNNYGYIANADSKKAFTQAMTASALTSGNFLDISTPTGKTKFFKLLDDSISNLANNLTINFGAVTQTTIGGGGSTPPPVSTCPASSPLYPAGRGSYVSGSCVKGTDGKLYKCISGVAAWCNSTAEWAYAPGTGTATTSAWTLQN